MRLWITRDRDSENVHLWDKLPIYKNGVWDRHSPVASVVSPINTQAAEMLLGHQWCNDGQFCCEIEVASVKRIRTRPEEIVKRLRALHSTGSCDDVLNDAADLIESLSKK